MKKNEELHEDLILELDENGDLKDLNSTVDDFIVEEIVENEVADLTEEELNETVGGSTGKITYIQCKSRAKTKNQSVTFKLKGNNKFYSSHLSQSGVAMIHIGSGTYKVQKRASVRNKYLHLTGYVVMGGPTRNTRYTNSFDITFEV